MGCFSAVAAASRTAFISVLSILHQWSDETLAFSQKDHVGSDFRGFFSQECEGFWDVQLAKNNFALRGGQATFSKVKGTCAAST